MTREELIKAIEEMSVLELAELVKELEEKFGVSAAAPAMMMAGVTHPTIIATMCWKARGSACPKGGIPPFSSKTDSFLCLPSFILPPFHIKRSYESKQKDSLIIAIFPLYVP